jgi:isoleucyl-tRNA synthetase
VLKDRLYTSAKLSAGRRSAQTVVWRIAHALTRLLAPITVFTSEEVWKFLPHRADDPASVHMTVFPAAVEFDAGLDEAARNDWQKLLQVRETVLKALEDARNSKFINAALEAKVTLRAEVEWSALLVNYAAWLSALFIASQVEVETRPEATEHTPEIEVRVGRADGIKCDRCWNYSTRVGESKDWPTLCERCVAALDENVRTLGTPYVTGAAPASSKQGGAA